MPRASATWRAAGDDFCGAPANAVGAAAVALVLSGQAAANCTRPVYLTLDTGHMGVAPLIADVLKRQDVRVTFFAANEATQQGDGSLGDDWAAWWRARAATSPS